MTDRSDAVLLEDGAAENKLQMGVTTLIGGEGGTPVPTADIPAYFSQLMGQSIAVNAAASPTRSQMRAMESEVTIAMRAGGSGISTALIYPPNNFQPADDLIRLASILGRCGGFYASHIRGESAGLLTALQEIIAIAEKRRES